MTEIGAKRLRKIQKDSLRRAQEKSISARSELRKAYLAEKTQKNEPLMAELSSDSVRKLMLATLYLAEGTKRTRGSLTFGNSDPGIIRLFLDLFRESFAVDEQKFRCTVQARNDQDLLALEEFWSRHTDIPSTQFYKTRVDARSIGQKSRKKEYKGVCRIDYLSADSLYELMVIGSMLTQGPVAQLVERANGIREVGGS